MTSTSGGTRTKCVSTWHVSERLGMVGSGGVAGRSGLDGERLGCAWLVVARQDWLGWLGWPRPGVVRFGSAR
jgi:hypothetical protein